MDLTQIIQTFGSRPTQKIINEEEEVKSKKELRQAHWIVNQSSIHPPGASLRKSSYYRPSFFIVVKQNLFETGFITSGKGTLGFQISRESVFIKRMVTLGWGNWKVLLPCCNKIKFMLQIPNIYLYANSHLYVICSFS